MNSSKNWAKQEIQDQRRIEDAEGAMVRRLTGREVSSADDPYSWFERADMTAFFPEWNLEQSELITTDCPGVPSAELLRLFDRVVIRLDALPDPQIFKELYFMTIDEMQYFASTGNFLLLRTSDYHAYPSWYRPLLAGEAVPLITRPLIISDILRNQLLGLSPQEGAYFAADAEALEYGSRWGLEGIQLDRFRSSLRSLRTLGFGRIVEEILSAPAPHSLGVASVASDILTTPLQASAGGVTQISPRAVQLVRERSAAKVDALGTVLSTGVATRYMHPEALLRRSHKGNIEYFHPSAYPRLRLPGEEFDLVVPTLDLWNFLRICIQPWADGISLTTTLGDEAPQQKLERLLGMPGRKEAQWYLTEAIKAARENADFKAVQESFATIKRINDEMEDSVASTKDPKIRGRVAFAASFAKKAVKYIPFVGSLMSDAIEFSAEATATTTSPRIRRTVEYCTGLMDKFLPEASFQSATIYPIFSGLSLRRSHKIPE